MARKKWSENDILLLKKMYVDEGISKEKIAENFNVTIPAISNKIRKMRFKRTPKHLSRIMSNANLGEKNGMYGKISPNRGLNKHNSERIRKMGEKVSINKKKKHERGLLPDISGKNNPMYGIDTWNKGKNKFNDKRIAKYGIKISNTKKENWLKLSEEEKDIIRKRMAHIGATCKKSKTKIEIITANILDDFNVDYIWGYQDGIFVYDFYLPVYNIVIECNGDYWHGNPIKYNETNLNDIQRKNIARDKRKITKVKKDKRKMLILWEHDINYDKDKVIKNIKDIINE